MPMVTFIPYDYEDGVTQTLTAYTFGNRNTDEIEISAVVEPTVPVMVISENERIDEDPWREDKPETPINVSAQQSDRGIVVSWNMPESTVSSNSIITIIKKAAFLDSF